MMIDSGTIDTLIRYNTGTVWLKSGARYEFHDSKYDIYIDTDGAIPVLVMEEKALFDRRGKRFGGRSRPMRAQVTDLTPFPGSVRDDGTPNMWVATLLDKASGGAIPWEDTARATIEEAKRLGLFVQQ